MPVHQISVVPVAKETASNNRTTNKNEANSLKAGPSQTVSASSHDICSSGETKLDADGSDQTTPVVPINPASTTKPPVKRRVRRRRGSTGAVGCAADRQRPPGARGLVRGSADSSSEDERRLRESRSWSREKARRRRSSGRQRSDQRQDDVQLLSVNSDEKENQPPQGPVAKLHPHRKSTSKSEERASQSEPAIQQRRSDGGSSGAGSRDEEEEAPITPSNENRGSEEVGVSAPPPDKRPDPAGHNGGSQHACSDDELEVCRICHCEGDAECPLITPCRCTGSLRFVHHGCLHQWIKSSDTRCCELCKYDFIMETQLKPLRKWEKLHMTRSERRKIFCAVFFHMVALVCVLWSVYVLVQRTIDDLQHGRNAALLRLSPLAALGLLEWPFWAKLTVVSMGVAGGLLFMYVQCKVYLQLWRRLKAFNRIIFVQNCPDTVRPPPPPGSEAPPSESITPV